MPISEPRPIGHISCVNLCLPSLPLFFSLWLCLYLLGTVIVLGHRFHQRNNPQADIKVYGGLSSASGNGDPAKKHKGWCLIIFVGWGKSLSLHQSFAVIFCKSLKHIGSVSICIVHLFIRYL